MALIFDLRFLPNLVVVKTSLTMLDVDVLHGFSKTVEVSLHIGGSFDFLHAELSSYKLSSCWTIIINA